MNLFDISNDIKLSMPMEKIDVVFLSWSSDSKRKTIMYRLVEHNDGSTDCDLILPTQMSSYSYEALLTTVKEKLKEINEKIR